MTGSLLLLILLSAAPVAVLVLAGRCYRWFAAPGRPALVRPRRQTPSCRPIEQVAADLRRLHALLDHEVVPVGPQGMRSRALLAAYDDVLGEAARLLAVPEALRSAPEGWDREVERLRVESGLFAAGLDVRP